MAMNELLSWYGYNELETKDEPQAMNSTITRSIKTSTASIKRSPLRLNLLTRRKSKLSSLSTVSAVSPCSSLSSCSSSSSLLSMSPPPSTGSSLSAVPTPTAPSTSSYTNSEIVDVNSFNEDKDDPFGLTNQTLLSESNEAGNVCSWCRRKNCTSRSYIFKTTRGHETFCSEICFSTYRRANFRRNKRCDWCRHVRNSVNYIDLQDGDNQYQFCSDKCLNQFKLDIFCQETKEHLDIHPYHRDQIPSTNDASTSLITPDMWLKNCTSPRESDKSRSTSPTTDVPNNTPIACPNFFTVKSEPKLIRPFVNNSSFRRETHTGKLVSKKTTKKKKLQKLRVPLSVRELTKKDDRSFPASVEFPTPKVSFQPNFSSMLPSDGESTQRSRPFLTRSPDAKPTSIKNFTSANLPIPPLLPINKSCDVPTPQITRPQQTSTSSATKNSPSSLLQKSNNSVLPFPTVLLPYPILLPIVLPIPIPIPVPITETKKTAESDNHDKNDNSTDS